ncbi:MAG: hypothetical protein KDA84_06155 [Planctomycetaceae bacterium]|nr:hypothetical protein [Planctomycetaceae bacterium]
MGDAGLVKLMDRDSLFVRYQDLQQYVGWTGDDAARLRAVASSLDRFFPGLVDDFYAEIERHSGTRKVITGGEEQVVRLKRLLTDWLGELLKGEYDADFVARRWRVGYRHVEIGLEQVYTNMALSRLRCGLHNALKDLRQSDEWNPEELHAIHRALDKILDLDLAIIEDVYQTEYFNRQQQTEKLVTIGQVAGGIAHELWNPLNVIKTSVYYLLNAKNASEDKKRQHLSRIERQVGLADGVIAALSNFAKLPVPDLQRVVLEEWLREVLEMISLPTSIEVALEGLESQLVVWCDPNQMQIVIRNLIRNAQDALPEGGRITITARKDAGWILLSVSDNGTGIPDDILHRIMDPLFTTKARGIGLGLSIAKAIVEKNNGQLSVRSVPERGAEFTLRLSTSPSS